MILFCFFFLLFLLEFAPEIESEMEIASLQLNNGLQQLPSQTFIQKRSKKQAKLLQQKMEHLARINIHLQGKH